MALETTVSGVASAAGVLAALMAFLWGLGKLLSLGGKPEQRGTAIYYNVKPMMRVIIWVSAIASLVAIWSGIQGFRHANTALGVIFLSIGVTFLLIAAICPSQIILDEPGMVWHRGIRPDVAIPWAELTHYETIIIPRSMTTNYFFRGANGQTIVVSSTGFDVTDMLERIRQRQPCPQQPFKRQHWYGS